jgi:hypothetical protein
MMDINLVRGTLYGLAFVAPFWIAVAWFLL